MKKLVVSILYAIFHIIRNGCLPGDYGTFVVEQQLNEPWENVIGNAWRWAEALPAPVELTESAEEFTAIRWDADNGVHAQHIYDVLMESFEWGWWSPEFSERIYAKAELFRGGAELFRGGEVGVSDESDELPEWAYDLDDDDECWF